MISRAILILKTSEGATRGVVKLTDDGRGTRAELRVDGFLPDVIAIRSRDYFELVTVAGGNMLLPSLDLERVEVACLDGERIYLYGANCVGDLYSMEVAVARYLATLTSRHGESAVSECRETESVLAEEPLDVLKEPLTGADETVSLIDADTESVVAESAVPTDDMGVSEESAPMGTEISIETADDASDSGADTVSAGEYTDYDDEPIVEPDGTVTSELYESVEVEPIARVGYLFGEIPVMMEEGVKDFYYSVKDTIEELFVCFPEDREISSLIPGRWVRVDSEEGYYVVGVTYEGETPRYVCYGVPRVEGVDPPEEIAPYCALIEDGEKGYWVMFQDAATGINVRREDECCP